MTLVWYLWYFIYVNIRIPKFNVFYKKNNANQETKQQCIDYQ
jgi:hypothetical protein